MINQYHALVWIDHREAKLFHFDADDSECVKVRSQHPHQHLHHKANARDSGHVKVDNEFLSRVADALEPSEAILITGPSNAKAELLAYIKAKKPKLADKISGVESLDHPTDGQLVALGRKYFKADDRMHAPSH